MTTTWTTSSSPSGNLPARLEARERARRPRHQEPIALLHDNALRVLRFHVRVTAHHAVLAADASDGGHRLDDGRMIVLARVAQILREVALADQHDADAFHLVEDARQVVDRQDVLAHDDHEDLAVRHYRPDVRFLVVLLRRDAPVARGMYRLIAANAFGLVRRRAFRTRVPARGSA